MKDIVNDYMNPESKHSALLVIDVQHDFTLIWPYASDQPSIKPLLTKLTYDNYKSIGQDIMGVGW
jgi:hypothetical protein